MTAKSTRRSVPHEPQTVPQRPLPRDLGIVLALMTLAAPSFADPLVIAGFGDSLTGATPTRWCGLVEAPHSCDFTPAVHQTEAGYRFMADAFIEALIPAPAPAPLPYASPLAAILIGTTLAATGRRSLRR